MQAFEAWAKCYDMPRVAPILIWHVTAIALLGQDRMETQETPLLARLSACQQTCGGREEQPQT